MSEHAPQHALLQIARFYLADVRKPGEAKKAVTDTEFIQKLKVVRTGADGD